MKTFLARDTPISGWLKRPLAFVSTFSAIFAIVALCMAQGARPKGGKGFIYICAVKSTPVRLRKLLGGDYGTLITFEDVSRGVVSIAARASHRQEALGKMKALAKQNDLTVFDIRL